MKRLKLVWSMYRSYHMASDSLGFDEDITRDLIGQHVRLKVTHNETFYVQITDVILPTYVHNCNMVEYVSKHGDYTLQAVVNIYWFDVA